ncbi:Zinc transporter ZIP1 [Portunus trituberculatus]|uniref:Zinc transporter ZIP1 n=1 Tax=Portunus trituberculatus TaxID=210409 RepID=A0A5B7G8D9_PORTR|nr:Zinc transporter ZIP1 [Portunus trituberculatus]
MWNIITIKGIVLVVMFIITFVCSMLPVLFVRHIRETHDSGRRSRYQVLLSLMSCSAGGVFMGTCILDLFPDVQQQLDLLMDQNFATQSYPVAEFIVVFGFLLVLTMEQIVLDYKEQSLLNQSETGSLSGASQGYNTAADHCGPEHAGAHSHNIFDHSVHHDIASHSSLRSLLLLFALSLHSVFEGLAVGLQGTIDDVVSLFLVVIFHKGIISFSLGLNMVQSKLSVTQVKTSLI